MLIQVGGRRIDHFLDVEMSAFPNSPRLLKGGIVLVDPDSGTVQRMIALQYNPDTLTPDPAAAGVQGERRPLGSDAA